jgi:hypothetical protein
MSLLVVVSPNNSIFSTRKTTDHNLPIPSRSFEQQVFGRPENEQIGKNLDKSPRETNLRR